MEIEWKRSTKSIGEWAKLFFMLNTHEDQISVQDMKEFDSFGEKAASHRMPSKPLRLSSKVEPFETKHEWKKWEEEVLAGKKSLELSGSNFSESVESQFKSLENIVNGIVKQVNENNEQVTKSVRMLEFERDNLKLEVGNRIEANVHSEFDSVSLWSIIGEFSDTLIQQRKGDVSSSCLPSDLDSKFKVISEKLKEHSKSIA